MIRTQYFRFLFLICILLVSYIAYSQQGNTDGQRSKVIISGKTYYLHVVQKGEGFYGIAKKYGVSQKEIQEANPKVIFGLKPGDILNIPIISGRNSSVDEIESSNEFIYHTIEKGQTLYFLSKKYHVSLDDIKRNNAGADQKLLVGTIIKIPVHQQNISDSLDHDFSYHIVERKETLYAISKRYHVTVDTLIVCNPALKSGILSVGSKIRIPLIEREDKPLKIEQSAKIEDDGYIYHKIAIGETLFSLSKKYNVSQDILSQTNPDLNADQLPLGFIVRVPKDAIKRGEQHLRKTEKDFKVHVVKKRETIYSISNKYGVSIKDIEEANPTIILINIRKGTKLQIPTPSYLDHIRLVAQQKLQASANGDSSIVHDTIHVNCDSYDYYNNAETINVAILLPFDIGATKKANIVKKTVDNKVEESWRQYPIISNRSKTFVEFYEGALLALDSLKKQGANIQLFTYDTAPDTNRVKQILEQPEMQMVDFIIGPAYASNLSLVSSFSQKHHIKMVYPLSSVNTQLTVNPFLFQINPPDTLLYDNYSKYIAQHHEESKIIILKSAHPNDVEEKLTLAIKNQLFLKYLPLGKSPDFVEVTFSEQDVQGVEALLNKNKLNVVVVPSPEEADVSKIVTTLHGVLKANDVKIKLVGFGSWLTYQTINAEELHDLNTEILTSYAIDYKDENTKNFILSYRQKFYTEPFSVSPYFTRSSRNSKYSRYGIWGFDVMYYFISARVTYGPQFEYCLPEFDAKQVQFNFHFQRSGNWGGFYNNGLFVLGFKPSLEILRGPF